LEEGAEATLQTPKTRSILLKAKKNVLLTSLTNELQADMMTSTEPKLWEQLTKAVAFSIDNVLLSGSGAGQPLGALNGSSVVEIAAETGQATGSIVVENIVKMAARLYPPCFGNAVWVTHPSALPQLLTLQTKIRNDEDEVVGGGQSGLLQPDGKGGYTILARPLLISEKMQAVGSRGDLAIVDFSEYIVGLRKEVSIDKSAHVFFASDKTAIRCIVRLDGQPKWSSAITPKNGTDTLSWAVVLGARS
jgi:HK97 family phage major capsid protein